MTRRSTKPCHPWPRKAHDNPAISLGVDVTARLRDIEKIVGAFFAESGIPKGLPAEDIIQEILLTIVRRNHTSSAFDPRKSSFASYICLVARNVVGHISQKSRKLKRIPHHLISSLEDPVSIPLDKGGSGEFTATLGDLFASNPSYSIDMEERMDLRRGPLREWIKKGTVEGRP